MMLAGGHARDRAQEQRERRLGLQREGVIEHGHGSLGRTEVDEGLRQIEGLLISSQYAALFGITFDFANGGRPRLAQVGPPRTAFRGVNAARLQCGIAQPATQLVRTTSTQPSGELPGPTAHAEAPAMFAARTR
jgi:hypothetical protein